MGKDEDIVALGPLLMSVSEEDEKEDNGGVAEKEMMGMPADKFTDASR